MKNFKSRTRKDSYYSDLNGITRMVNVFGRNFFDYELYVDMKKDLVYNLLEKNKKF